MVDVFRWQLCLSLAPDMKRVGEDYVTKQIVIRAIANVQRGVELKIGCYVAGEADRG